jgi:hypothetical protein
MKRCEWVSGLDLIDFAIGFEVQVSVEQLSVDPFERQTLFASLMNQFQVNVGVLHCAYLSLVKLYDTSPALLYQGNALAYFRRLPLRPVNGATVSDYYGGSATLGVSACRPSRVCFYETLSVVRCHVLCCSHQAHCSRFTGESVPHSLHHMRIPVSPFQVCYDGCGKPPPRTSVRCSLTIHTGFAERRFTYLQPFSTLMTCCFPL